MKPRIARSVSQGQWVAWFWLDQPWGPAKYTGYGETPKAAYCSVMYWATVQQAFLHKSGSRVAYRMLPSEA